MRRIKYYALHKLIGDITKKDSWNLGKVQLGTRMLWHAMKWYDMLRHTMMCCDILWYTVIDYDMLWYAVIYYDMLWYAMLWYAMLWYAMTDVPSFKGTAILEKIVLFLWCYHTHF